MKAPCDFCEKLAIETKAGPAFFGDGSENFVFYCEDHRPVNLPEPPSFWEDRWGRKWFQEDGEIIFLTCGQEMDDYLELFRDLEDIEITAVEPPDDASEEEREFHEWLLSLLSESEILWLRDAFLGIKLPEKPIELDEEDKQRIIRKVLKRIRRAEKDDKR